MNRIAPIAPLTLLLATACLDDGGSSGDPELVTYSAVCSSDSVHFEVEVSTNGAGSVTVEVDNAAGEREMHELIDDGYYRRDDVYIWYVDLDTVSSFNAQADDVSTQYNCDIETWAMRVIVWDPEDYQAACEVDDITNVGAFNSEECY
jgi:hypothetical protein